MAISRMQEPQQIQGGLGSLQDPRQNYGLGKLVKKAFRGIKKVAKSPLGKAAIMGGLGMWGMGAGPFSGGKLGGGFLRGLMSKGTGGGLWGAIKGGAGKAWGLAKANPWKAGALGLGAAAVAAPFFMGKDDEEEEVEESWTNVPSSIADIRNQAQNYYKIGSAGSNLNFMPNKQFVNANYYAADGGRVGLLNGGGAGEEQMEQMLMAEFVKYKNQGGTLTFEQFVQAVMKQQQEQQQGGGMEQPQEVAMAADGGRIGYAGGQLVRPSADGSRPGYRGLLNILPENNKRLPSGKFDFLHETGPIQDYQKEILKNMSEEDIKMLEEQGTLFDFIEKIIKAPYIIRGGDVKNWAQGGRIGAYKGGPMSQDEDEYNYNPQAAMRMYRRPGKQEGGIMETDVAEEMIDMGGQEKDYRETGGFVDLGGKERADDVPARLSKNEFVFTADAVRAAGGGNIDAGSEVMQNMMNNLEQGGEISEDSQGLEGAQAMYDQQQMLQSRIA